jgi:hypothetical protein
MTAPRNRGPLTCVVALLVVSTMPTLKALRVPQPKNGEQSVTAIPKLIDTKYCYGDAEVYSVWLRLRMKYVNRTKKNLILDKQIGKAWYSVKVARNLDALAAGKYEYDPNTDWFVSDKELLPDKPNGDSPSPDFVVLAPGETFVSEVNAAVVAQYKNPKDFPGSIRSGVHVLQLELSARNHPGEASAFAEPWRKFGELVTGVIKTEPIEIRIPSDTKIEKECK